MSRDRASVRFNTTLDPGLRFGARDAGIVGTKGTSGKGKARAICDGDNDNRRSRARKPMSRVNSLILSTDSPKLTRVQHQLAESSAGEGSTLMSTIGSFGIRGNVQTEAGTLQKAPSGQRRKEKRTTNSQEEQLSDVRTRKRAISPTTESMESAVLMPYRSISELPSSGADSADDEWDKIWQRWNTQTEAVRFQTGEKTRGMLQDVVEGAEKGLTSSQHSLVSLHSEEGQFGTTWSIHEQLYPEIEPGSIEGDARVVQSIEDPDDSRSRMDEGLVLDGESDSETEKHEEDEWFQHRLDTLCNKVLGDPVRRVQQIVFEGNDVRGEKVMARNDERVHLLTRSSSTLFSCLGWLSAE